MGTKTIGITEEVYDRLAAEKREDESFMETVARLIDESASDWRRGFGRYSDEEGEGFERVITESRDDHAEGIAGNHDETLEAIGFELDSNGNIVSGPADPDSLRAGAEA